MMISKRGTITVEVWLIGCDSCGVVSEARFNGPLSNDEVTLGAVTHYGFHLESDGSLVCHRCKHYGQQLPLPLPVEPV